MEVRDGLVVFKVFEGLHKAQLESSGVPEKFWYTLYHKIAKNIFDAGESFTIFRIDYEGDEKGDGDPIWTVLVTDPNGIYCNDPSQIYLIDHAWTYDCNRAERDLRNIGGLLQRMSSMMGIEMSRDQETNVENVCREMWKFNQTYSPGFGTIENRVPVWYIMDEFGSAIEHSDYPNFRCVPFFNVFEQSAYSILFPIRNVENMEKVTRDYLEGPFAKNENTRQALMIPWEPASFLDIDYSLTPPEELFFRETNETLGNGSGTMTVKKDRVLKVYSEYDIINEYLRHPGFEMVDSADEADILWLTSHFKNYQKFWEETPKKFINQFPYEGLMTMKYHLAVICRRKRDSSVNPLFDNPVWFPVTYDLSKELIQFVSFYQSREMEDLNNLWICKPWNMSRGLDIVITDNLNCIMRLPASGPKLAQKYLENPVLFERPDVGLVKFDIRYMVLLKSVQPLRVYAYRKFFLRFASLAFELRDFCNKKKHLTLMNYQEGVLPFRVRCDEFIHKFQEQYPNESWLEVEGSIFKAVREMFEAVTLKPPPLGIGANIQSRALYAVDLMLSWDDDGKIQPKIIEVNWLPDCERACRYYPTFFDDVFLLLFKDEWDSEKFELLE